MWKIVLIILALIYALSPYDILPDFLIGWGWLDDLVIIGLLVRFLYAQKKKQQNFQQFGQGDQRADYFGRRQKGDDDTGTRNHANSRETSSRWDPHKILGVDKDASAEDIKSAYRQLAGKYHPDKVEHLGDEFKNLAENRFKEIQRAYQELKQK